MIAWPVFDALLIPAMEQSHVGIASCSPGLAGYLCWEVSFHPTLRMNCSHWSRRSQVCESRSCCSCCRRPHDPSFDQGVALQLGAEEEPAEKHTDAVTSPPGRFVFLPRSDQLHLNKRLARLHRFAR